jgi:hypothetical protein
MQISKWLRGAGAAGVALAMVAAIVACQKSEDMPPALGDEGTTIIPPPGGGGGGDSGDSATTGDGAMCGTLANNATPVDERYVGDTLPLPLGGTIANGTYFLTAVNVYTGIGGNVGLTGRILTETTTFDTSTSTRTDVIQIDFSDGGIGTPITSSGAFATNATTFTYTATCGASAGSTFSYSVLGSTLHLYSAPNEIVFTLQ